jgi:hypothetical protein
MEKQEHTLQSCFVQVDDVGLNLAMLVSWEWNPKTQFLVVRLVNDILYLHGQQGQALWLLLERLAAVRVGDMPGGKASL